MTVSLSLLAGAGWQFFDDNGNPLSGGLLYTYEAGTTTPLATYTDSNGNVANANPIVLDAAGRIPYQVWLNPAYSYKFVLKTSLAITVWTEDNIVGANRTVAPVAVSVLPSASITGAGAKAFVSDATVTTFASVVVGGGANTVPVYSDGTNWRIG